MSEEVAGSDGAPTRVTALATAFWEGMDGADGTPLIGRGWAVLQDDRLNGMFFIHHGDESDFVAKRAVEKPTKSRKKNGPKGR